jgi:hypothetical protein
MYSFVRVSNFTEAKSNGSMFPDERARLLDIKLDIPTKRATEEHTHKTQKRDSPVS